jgi:hypothetical protein
MLDNDILIVFGCIVIVLFIFEMGISRATRVPGHHRPEPYPRPYPHPYPHPEPQPHPHPEPHPHPHPPSPPEPSPHHYPGTYNPHLLGE